MNTTSLITVVSALVALGCADAAELLDNGGFEKGLSGWRAFWSRERDAGQAVLDSQTVHGGSRSLRIEHRGSQDWSVNASQAVEIQVGDVFELEGWVRGVGPGSLTLCVQVQDAAGTVVDWAFAARTVGGDHGWTQLRRRFVVPEGVARLEPRLIGHGPSTNWVDDVVLRRSKRPPVRPTRSARESPGLTNAFLEVHVDETNGTLSVLDRRNGRTWSQRVWAHDVWPNPGAPAGPARLGEASLRLGLYSVASDLELTATIQLEPQAPELTVTLNGGGTLSDPLAYPHPFVSEAGTYLVVPMNEGISYPVDDPSIEPMRLIAYGGHGICMAFWGVTDGQAGQMAIFETPDDAAIRIERREGRFLIAPEWDPIRGGFGTTRRLRYVFFDQGGHMAIAKRYRAYAQAAGRFKTLARKREENPNVDLLVGAVNVWCWERDAAPFVREMQSAGIDRILWSNRQSPENLRTLNQLGVLTSRYDIYQDVMDPGNFKFLRGVHPDWTTEAWPNDVIVDARGRWQHGWEVQGTNGVWYACGVICDRQALPYAARRIPAELKTHDYRCRFIDTTTAAPWHECYATNHPMTRAESRAWKMKLLRYVRSYRNLGPVVRAVGYAEMTDHRFLTSDRSVQQTAFGNGTTVTVNFGPATYQFPDGAGLPPSSFKVTP